MQELLTYDKAESIKGKASSANLLQINAVITTHESFNEVSLDRQAVCISDFKLLHNSNSALHLLVVTMKVLFLFLFFQTRFMTKSCNWMFEYVGL